MADSGDPGLAGPANKLEAILSSVDRGIAAIDGTWRLTYVNAAGIRLLRRPADVLLGRPLLELLTAEPDSAFHACFSEVSSSGQTLALAAYSDRLGLWLELQASSCADGLAIFFRDVTPERDAEHALLDSRRTLAVSQAMHRRIFETSQDLILVVTRQGDLVQVSPSSLAILGYRSDEMIGHVASDFLYPEDLENTREQMRLARRGRLMRHFQTRYVHRDGRVVPLIWMGIWSEAEQQHFFVGRDMTEQIAAEERLRRAQRLEAVGQLTGGMAHDFNNLLAVVIGNIDLLQSRIGGDPMAVEYAGNALGAALRGADLTRQLLAFARRQPLDARAVLINERVSAITDLLRRTLGEQIQIATALAPDLWPAFVDVSQFESALVNLSINARDAMPNGGRLSIETANTRLDEHYVGENIEVAVGDYVLLAVSDTGTGMPPEVLARAFEPFFTTKGPGGGTGLGLSMVYGFARQSQGHIKIYSEVGHGTTVRLYLRRAAVSPAMIAEAKVLSLPSARVGERILLVEDDPQVRKVVAAQLAEFGYQVIETDTAEAALHVLERGEPLDLLFTDVVMPGGMRGDDLARRARMLRPQLKVLLTSGFAQSSMQRGARVDDFKHLLSKPYRKSDLAAKLRAVLDGDS